MWRHTYRILLSPAQGISFAALSAVLLLMPGASSSDEPAASGISVDSSLIATPEALDLTPSPVTVSRRTAPRFATLAFTGDILPHKRVGAHARRYAGNTGADYNFTPMFEQVSPKLQAADLAICHLETTISDGPVTGYPRFKAPPELVEAIAETGWDGCSLASNHAFDFGVDGVAKTIRAMRQNGLAFAGTAMDKESSSAARYDVNGIRVSHLSYTYGLNGARLPENQPWWVNLLDVEAIMNDAKATRNEGAEFVVASLHWGMEYRRMPTTSQERIAREIAALGTVDLLIGHHAHVLQPIDRIGDMWVVYGMGNFLSNQSPRCCTPSSEDGAILTVEIGDSPEGLMVRSITYVPTRVDRTVMQVVAVADQLADPDLGHFPKTVLCRSWQRTVDAFGALGADQLGVRPAPSTPCPATGRKADR